MSLKFPVLDYQATEAVDTNLTTFELAKVGESSYPKRKVDFVGKAAVVTLGCAKNQVDSEVMLGSLEAAGFEIVNELSEAEVAVVNTCGFLQSAVKESIDAILNAAEYKTKGRLRKLLVAGCMVERFRSDMKSSLPEVDGFLAIDDVLKVGAFASGAIEELAQEVGRPYFLYDDKMPRRLSTLNHTAYVKIAEGCNRPCTFCIIPRIRGLMRSRPTASILNEALSLANSGVKEINLVAQDLTDYGNDRRLAGENIVTLLQALNDLLNERFAPEEGIKWIRLLYAYPLGINKLLIEKILDLPRVAKYLDLPLQHVAPEVLKVMKRPLGRFSPRSIVELIKEVAGDNIALRTTFIVGFPGETEAHIAELVDFVSEGHFSSVGVFTYSKEEGTPSADLAQHVPERIKQERRKRVMAAQASVLKKRMHSFVGRNLKVLLEAPHEDTDLLLVGRTEWQAPEVDGVIMINDNDSDIVKLDAGKFYDVEITEVSGYDLIGKVVGVA
jgi:ribosomal protein S12 methylthiotransferase